MAQAHDFLTSRQTQHNFNGVIRQLPYLKNKLLLTNAAEIKIYSKLFEPMVALETQEIRKSKNVGN